MQLQLLAQQIITTFRHDQQEITQHIQEYRSALMAAFGSNVSENDKVREALAALRRSLLLEVVHGVHMGCA